MENHPIPQDITGFQFKLIGDMTIKQFGYVAVGVILGWIAFSIPLTFLIKYPLILFFVLFGAALAFLPVEGRPLDLMITNFFKALFSPSHYIYDKEDKPLFVMLPVIKKMTTSQKPEETSQTALKSYLAHMPTVSKNALDEKEQRFLLMVKPPVTATEQLTHQKTTLGNPFTNLFGHASSATPVQPIQPQEEEDKDKTVTETLSREALLLTRELAVAKQEEAKQTDPGMGKEAHQKVLELEKELQDILAQKQQLEQQLTSLQKQLTLQKQQVYTPGVVKPMQQSTNVKKIPLGMGKQVGLLATPDAPNLISGIVKDARNNVLPNILIEVKDRDGNAVRAFKTNGLGQFRAATQLPDGIYSLWFEDSTNTHKFDPVELTMAGEIVSPLEVTSSDPREELRKQLFATT